LCESDASKDGINEVQGLWLLAYGGTIGMAIKGVAPRVQEAFARGETNVTGHGHRYEVVDRNESDSEIIITLEYRQE